MKPMNFSARIFITVGLATTAGLSLLTPAIANPIQPTLETNGVERPSPNQTVQPTVQPINPSPQIQLIKTEQSPFERELPTFQIKAEPRSQGILGVLGGSFKDEDRHPSFRNSTLSNE